MEIWNFENQWLEAFAESFSRATRRMVHDVVTEVEDDCVLIAGRAQSYYAVQLAIHGVETFNRNRRSPFATTRLSLEVGGNPLELWIPHPLVRRREAGVATRRNKRASELTCA